MKSFILSSKQKFAAVISSFVLSFSSRLPATEVYTSWAIEDDASLNTSQAETITFDDVSQTVSKLNPLGQIVWEVALPPTLGISSTVINASQDKFAISGGITLASGAYRGWIGVYSVANGSALPGWPKELTMNATRPEDRSVQAIAFDGADNLSAAGFTPFGSDGVTNIEEEITPTDGWVGRFSINGALLWETTVRPGAAGRNQLISYVAVTPGGETFVAVESEDVDLNSYVHVRKFTATGSVSWTQQKGSATDTVKLEDFIIDGNANPVLLWSDDNGINLTRFAGAGGTPSPTGAVPNAIGASLASAAANELLVSGYYHDSNENTHGFCAKLNATSGSTVWRRNFQETSDSSVVANVDGNEVLVRIFGDSPATGLTDDKLKRLALSNGSTLEEYSLSDGLLPGGENMRRVGDSLYFSGRESGRVNFGYKPLLAVPTVAPAVTTSGYEIAVQSSRPGTLQVQIFKVTPGGERVFWANLPSLSTTIPVFTHSNMVWGLDAQSHYEIKCEFTTTHDVIREAASIFTGQFNLGPPTIIHEGKTFSATLADEINDHGFISPNANNWTLSFWVAPQSTNKSWPLGATPGQDGVSAEFPGTSQFVLFPAYTEEANTSNAGIAVGTDRITVFEHRGGSFPCVLNSEVNLTGKLVHVALVYQNRVPHLFVDGQLLAVGQIGPLANIKLSMLGVGGGAYGELNGHVSDLRVYNRALSTPEVAGDRSTSVPENSIAGLVYRLELLAPPIVQASNAAGFMKLRTSGETLAFNSSALSHGGLDLSPASRTIQVINPAIVAKFPAIEFTAAATTTAGTLSRAFYLNVAQHTFPRFTQWLGQQFSLSQLVQPQISGFNSDPDGDGMANILEYATGNLPLTPSSPAITILGMDFYYTQNPLATDVVLQLQTSTNLHTWTNTPAISVAGNPSLRRYTTPAGQIRNFARLSASPSN